MPKSDPTIGMISEIGDRGVPALAIVTTANYSVAQGKYVPLRVDTVGDLKTTLSDVAVSLKAILNALVRPMWIDPTSGRLNINNVTLVTTVSTVSAVTAVTTVGDLTRLNFIGPTAATQQSSLYTQLYGQDRLMWNNCVRQKVE
jgi:hypothetical protein